MQVDEYHVHAQLQRSMLGNAPADAEVACPCDYGDPVLQFRQIKFTLLLTHVSTLVNWRALDLWTFVV
jgi:hypothetical protein